MGKELRLMADFFSSPLWVYDERGDLYDEPLPSEFGLPSDLVGRLNNWSEIYKRTYNEDDPASSGFSSLDKKEEFENQGLELRKDLEAFVGDKYRVTYFSVKDNKILR